MRVLLPLLLFAVSAQAQWPAILNILKAVGMTKHLECALPCILDSANQVPCDEKGAAWTICTRVDEIAEKVSLCTAKCDTGTATSFVVDLTKWVCKQAGQGPVDEEAVKAKAVEGEEKHQEL